jgi:TonB family protein
MFDALVASGDRTTPRFVPSSAIALLTHLTLGAAVWGSLRTVPAAIPAQPPVLVWPQNPEPSPLAPPSAPAMGGMGPVPPDVIRCPRIDLPPLGASVSGVPDPSVRAQRAGARGENAATDPSGLWVASAVDEQPVLLAGAPAFYPEQLRRAGIAGRVVVEAVLDTAGQAEPGSVRVVASPDRGFDAAAQRYVLGAVFRPARVHGRAVRVLVRVPIDFALPRATW